MDVLELIGDIANIATAIIAASSIVAALTPTPKDDAYLAKLYRLIDIMALNIGKAKQ